MAARTGPEGRLSDTPADFSELTALFINTTLTRSPGASHTQLLVDASASIVEDRREQPSPAAGDDGQLIPGEPAQQRPESRSRASTRSTR